MFRSSKVSLGFSDTGWHRDGHVIPSENLQCRLRDFEVPMSGGFYLVQKAPGHDDYYKIGEEIETWSESEELADKVIFYSKNVTIAERIRKAGQLRALQSHTWRHRFDQLFGRIKASGRLV
jgi:spore maturation protein CgeB